MKLTYTISDIQKYVSYKNGINSTNILYTSSYESFPIIMAYEEGKFLKRILTYLHCTKYNEIKICQSDVQSIFPVKNGAHSTNILHKGSHKIFLTFSLYKGRCLKVYCNAFPLDKI